MGNKESNCKKYTDLITDRLTGKINPTEDIDLNAHLSECSSCRQFQASSINISNALMSETNKSEIVFPEIKRNLEKELYAQTENKKTRWLDWFRAIFEYRIPAYQAAVAFIILFLIMISDFSVPRNMNNSTEMLADSQSTRLATRGETFPSYAWQWMDSQRVGINVKEDTIFTRFIVPSN